MFRPNCRPFPGAAPSVILLALASCGGGENDESLLVIGSELDSKPDGSLFIPAPEHFGGRASSLALADQGLRYGRMVDVFGLDFEGRRVPMFRDFVVAPALTSNSDWILEENPVTARTALIIQHDVGDLAYGRPQFLTLLAEAEARGALPDLYDAGLGGGAPSSLPRNAVLVLEFNDLLDEATISPQTVQVRVGVPPTLPFEARIFGDPNHGGLADADGDGLPEFHPSRLLIDPTVSILESLSADPPVAPNSVGFPASVTVNQSNLALRVPTVRDSGLLQSTILANLVGSGLSTEDNGTIDWSSDTADVLRLLRTRGDSNITGDEYNGFLPDNLPPQLVGEQPASVVAPPVHLADEADPYAFLLPRLAFDAERCARAPVPGDVVRQPGVFAEVTAYADAPVDSAVDDVLVRLLAYPAEWDDFWPADEDGRPQGFLQWSAWGAAASTYLSTYDANRDVDRTACFLRTTPTPDLYPTTGVSTSSTFTLYFSEPMDPASATAFDSLMLTRVPEPSLSTDYVVGTVAQSLDFQRFAFVPDLPLAHEFGSSESYWIHLAQGARGPTDLAGNALTATLPPVEVTVRAADATRVTGGRVTRFTSQDEEFPFADEVRQNAEWTGQHLYDLQRELIRPRPVVRFQGVIDREQMTIGIMNAFTPGVQTPLSKLGSKMQMVWRHVDFGYGLLDQSNYNLDVEGLYWAPINGHVNADHYNQFEMRLAHGRRLPDEVLSQWLLPAYPNSGVVELFEGNILKGGALDVQQQIVHQKGLGYTISPGDRVTTSSGTILMPYPLNRGVPMDEYVHYTWRDNEILLRGGPLGNGAEIGQYYALLGQPPEPPIYPKSQVQTCGLPLLMEFRCYPDDEAVGLNAFDVSLAINSSAAPYFRAFSTGGQGQQGTQVVDPDTESSANGGFNPNSEPPGEATHGVDPVVYLGAADFVVRISRSYSIWFPVGVGDGISEDAVLLANAAFEPPIMEPEADQQPLGTGIELHFRGATASVTNTKDPRMNATALNGYGDWYGEATAWTVANANPGITFLNGFTWKDEVAALDGAAYYQVRVTFQSNHATGLTPELSALAFAWSQEP